MQAERKRIQKGMACNQCRKSKRKCDGQTPCGQCKKRKRQTEACSYSCISKVDRSHIDLQNIVTQRKYIESYMAGLNTVVMLHRQGHSVDALMQATSKSKRLQLNAILATATRAFGAPQHVYSCFQRNALSLADEVCKESTYDAALAFNYLSFYFWGKNNAKSTKYRDTSLSICTKAIRQPENIYDKKILAQLQLETLGIQNISDELLPQQIPDFFPEDVRYLDNNQCESSSIQGTSILEVERWAYVLFEAERLFVLDTDWDYYNTMDEDALFRELENMNLTALSIPQPNHPAFLLVTATTKYNAGLHYYAAGYLRESIHYITQATNVYSANDYLMGLTGPVLAGFFHAAFLVTWRTGWLLLARQINTLQEKMSSLYPETEVYYLRDKNYLSQPPPKWNPPQGVTSVPRKAAPFGWMLSYQAPNTKTSHNDPIPRVELI